MWQRAAEAAEKEEEDAASLRKIYTFGLHSARLLRVILFLADSPDYSSDLSAVVFARLSQGRELAPVGKQARLECVLELWAKIIQLHDSANQEDGSYWKKLGDAFDNLRK